ncbi:MAG: aldehyde dehydrogenase family protein [Planctomycetes bacterium]|nr:aldehyde dehydrogenase family protein [Planctomycetota bacterium]
MDNDIPRALAAARDLFESGRTRSLSFRREQLARLAAEVAGRRGELLEALRQDLGKPPLEAYFAEIRFSLAEIRAARRNLPRWARPRRVRGGAFNFPSRCRILPEPYGVALIAAPWNYPISLVLSPLASALAAGNCAILKPSELAPASAAALRRLIAASLEPGLATVVEGGPEAMRALLAEKFDTILFTGSQAVGRLVMEAASKNLTPLTLELGGKSPCIVDRSADLALAAKRISWGKFLNAGQTCVAPDYACLPRERLDEFAELMRRTLVGFYGEDPACSHDYARIIHERHFDRLQALATGDLIQVGKPDRDRRFFPPTLIRGAGWEHPALRDEIFGPILPLVPYDDLAEPMEAIRRRPRPLALYLFARDRGVEERFIRGTSSGSVCINDTIRQITPLGLPLGGVGESGFGRYRGRFGFETFSHEKSVMKRYRCGGLPFIFPPYGSAWRWIRRWIGGDRIGA